MTIKKHARLSTEQADQILADVFEVCRMEPNTVSLETLEDYSSYRAERFTLRKVIVVLIMLAFLAMPFLFMAPELTMADKTTDKASPQYEVAVHSLLPVKSITAEIDGKNVPVFETAKGVFTVSPEISGKMTVTATIINSQINTVQVDVKVANRDKTPPVLDSSRVIGSRVYLYVYDDDTGVDYSSVTASDSGGSNVDPIDVIPEEQCIIFQCPSTVTTVNIADKKGNLLQLTLRPTR